jgi:hypothetical protein
MNPVLFRQSRDYRGDPAKVRKPVPVPINVPL